MARRPNIVFIMTDQQSAPAMSCTGNTDLSTPAMDRLASEGVRFERCYCSQPLCGPNRASMFSGLMPLEVGATRNGHRMNERATGRTLGEVLAGEGYDCAYAGKWHIPEISVPDGLGFRRIAPFGDRGLGKACVEYLREPHEQPFFLVASIDNPHNICEWGRGERLPWGELPDPPPVAECPALPPNFEPPADEPEIVRIEQAANWVMYPGARFDEAQWRRHRWAYYRLVEKADRLVGEILDTLDEAGLAEDTLVVFSSDHGDGHGAHRWNQKSVLYEEVIRVPLVVRWPGHAAAGRVDTEHVISNGLDLMPTLCDAAGAETPKAAWGRSIRPLLGGSDASWRDELVVETEFDGDRGYHTEGRAIIVGPWKYVVYKWGRPREQLFDLASDPGETASLLRDPGAAEALAECRRRLRQYCQEHDSRHLYRFNVPGV